MVIVDENVLFLFSDWSIEAPSRSVGRALGPESKDSRFETDASDLVVKSEPIYPSPFKKTYVTV